MIDRGLQAERTILAWWRTALTAGVAGALIVRQAVLESAHWAFTAAAAIGLAVLLGVAVTRVAALQRHVEDPVAVPYRVAATFVGGTLALQVLAMVLVAGVGATR